MKNAPTLYSTLIALFGQHAQWLDKRHLYTLVWMVVGVIESGTSRLPEWVPFVESRATYAQSTVRRFSRWLANECIEVAELYGPLIQEALRDWGGKRLYAALDTSLLWNQYCLIRLSIVYRGRAIPLVWRTLDHSSSMVTFETYRVLLDYANIDDLLRVACERAVRNLSHAEWEQFMGNAPYEETCPGKPVPGVDYEVIEG